jgi:hypothetical protein
MRNSSSSTGTACFGNLLWGKRRPNPNEPSKRSVEREGQAHSARGDKDHTVHFPLHSRSKEEVPRLEGLQLANAVLFTRDDAPIQEHHTFCCISETTSLAVDR